MSYTITVVNHTPITVQNGSTDNTTSLTLVGKNYPNYGQLIEQNLIYLLQNFAGSSQPVSPVTGQLWWNTSANTLQIYTGSAFKNVSGITVSTSQPTTSVIQGDLWYKSDDAQLYVYNGLSWLLIGPSYTTSQQQTNAIALNVTDTGLATHTVLGLFVGNVLTAVLSKDPTFTPNSTFMLAYSGFSTIQPGMNIASSYVGYGRTISNVSTAGSVNGTYTVDWSVSDTYTMTLTGSTTLAFTNPPLSGKSQTMTLVVAQDSVGSRTLTYPGGIRWSNGLAPTLTTIPNNRDVIKFTTVDGGSTYIGNMYTANVAP